ncbi:MAG: hypothetical protein J5367_07380 [Lachnospiraceae bacterium]|nr:hypothetical protein [Lachnospiraceae bacterium]
MIVKALLVIICNFILYLAFGSFFTVRKGRGWSLPVAVTVGFFVYYALFAVFCLPIMFTYRPLSLLTRVWAVPCAVILAAAIVCYGRRWIEKFRKIVSDRTMYPFWAGVIAVTVILVILAVITYNFTLDAAYYVANVTTNVDTDMINVYDPFTGNWQDHFELRYVFATYYTADAVVCQLTGLPALIQTRFVMAATVIVIVNMLYVYICRYFWEDHRRAFLMYLFMTFVNLLFISLYTSSNFLATRTYEGKSIVGNISIVMIFILYMMLIKEGESAGVFMKLFIVCLGTATVSSTANMVIPAAVFIMFVPYAVLGRKLKLLGKILMCIVPEIVMMIVYVLYVKGYYAIYTFPR